MSLKFSTSSQGPIFQEIEIADGGGCVIEIVGEALRVGPKVTLIKPGQRVGVGAQSYSCLNCRQCNNDNETYCEFRHPNLMLN